MNDELTCCCCGRFAFGVLRRFIPDAKMTSVRDISLTADGMAAVFDVPDEDVDFFLAGTIPLSLSLSLSLYYTQIDIANVPLWLYISMQAKKMRAMWRSRGPRSCLLSKRRSSSPEAADSAAGAALEEAIASAAEVAAEEMAAAAVTVAAVTVAADSIGDSDSTRGDEYLHTPSFDAMEIIYLTMIWFLSLYSVFVCESRYIINYSPRLLSPINS